MAKYPIGLLEEELKNKVAADWFAAFDTTRIIGKVDFCVAIPATELNLYEAENALWAEAKAGVRKDSLEYAMADRAFRQTNYACPDDDGDHVYDGGEKSAYKGLYSREDNPDTYGIAQLPDWTSYRAYGDDEVRARLLETNTSEDRYHVDCDWSNPGCQHETPFGP